MTHLQNISRIIIDPLALQHNIRIFRQLCPQSLFAAVIKSNAYGHGLSLCVPHLTKHVDYFAVNTIHEMQQIRELDPVTPVLVLGLNGLDMDALEVSGAISQKAAQIGKTELVLSSLQQLKRLIAEYPTQKFHLKIDTGLSRMGMSFSEFEQCLSLLQAKGLDQWTGLMTHFANVEDVSDQSYALQQLHNFNKARKLAHSVKPDLIYHSAASAAAMILPQSRMDLIRVGIALYGFWPSPETRLSFLSQHTKLPELKPALQWEARIVQTHDVKAGASLGYGCTRRVEQNTRVAIIPVGYFEGYDRLLSNQAYVLIAGRRAPLLGRVSMNMIIVDVSLIDRARIGEPAVLIGEVTHPQTGQSESITVDQLAAWTGSINYEIVTRILPGIERVLKNT